MSRAEKQYMNEKLPFVCANCGAGIAVPPQGTMNRNHCPSCLYSLHVDHRIGDRLSVCRGIMEPVGIWVRDNGEWAILHRCRKCGIIRANRIAGDDNALALQILAMRPVSGFSTGAAGLSGAADFITVRGRNL